MNIIVDNLAIEYLDEGQGPVILMLHGWGLTARHFEPLCRALGGFRIVRPDLPGFGSSQMPEKPWTVGDYARFVARVCEKLAIEPRAILGHSFGGRIAMKGVAQASLHPEKLVLVASAGVAHRRTARNLLYAAVSKIGKVVLSPLPRGAYERARRALYARTGSDYLTIRHMEGTFLNMIREDLSDSAAAIDVPTLLVWGENDAVTPVSEAQKLHRLIKGSRLELISGCGHFVYREKPEEVARLVKEFV